MWFNRFRIGIWPEYFEGVQFSRDTEALDQFFRQMTPTLGTADFEVYSDASSHMHSASWLDVADDVRPLSRKRMS